jgi:imidazolonepropionase-like amidohydrolase
MPRPSPVPLSSRIGLDASTLGALLCALALTLLIPAGLRAQMEPTTPRGADEGGGPYERLIIRGATMIDGTGAPPMGPVDIVIQGDSIAEIRSVGYPGVPIDERRRPRDGDRVIEWEGNFVMPGFVDMHAHTGGVPKAPQAEYVYKLWMAHGITTSRGVGHGPLNWSLREKAAAERNEIVAPRMFTYARPGQGWRQGVPQTPDEAREWVRFIADYEVDGARVDGLKLSGPNMDPPVFAALVDEADRQGLGTVAHLGQTHLARLTALDAAEAGLDMMTHYYGLFESLLTDYSIQDWPLDYNYNNEQHRFGQVGRLWYQSAEPGSEEWDALIERFLELDFAIDPTMTIYEASRDVMRAREAEWHDEYTLPTQWDFFQPARVAHGSYWFYWTTEDEYHWKKFYQKWMRFLNDFKNAGGVVTTGSDSGFIYKLYGFDYIREFELLREAGFHPLEVLRAATYHGALQLHEPKGLASDEDMTFGMLRPGMKADLVLIDENPLENLKVFYGTGAVKLDDDTGEVERVGGISYTIKDGIVYDAKRLLADVREMVRAQKVELGMDPDRGPGG